MPRSPQYRAAPAPAHERNPNPNPALDFPDRDLLDMTAEDYRRLGFMCGLEIHQQVASGRKLFCRCPSGHYTDAVDAEVLRHMRPTLGEMGQYDGCALMEFKTKKDIVYLLERSSVCTYDIDDTPPFEIDPTSVQVALTACHRLGLGVVDELQVMRKQYLDGSIPAGFQRTTLVGVGGRIDLPGADAAPEGIRIRQLSLEEDACREVSDDGHRIVFRTDRLGTPLIETVTEPDLRTPRDVQRAGRVLSTRLALDNQIRRGPGCARQDINVSVAGGRRVEIKGVGRLSLVPKLVHNEAFRQLNLLRIRAELQARKLRVEDFRIDHEAPAWESDLAADVGALVRHSPFAPVTEALDRGDRVCAVRLPGFDGLLAHRTQPGITFAREFADRVRVIACLSAQPFMISSQVADYGLDARVWRQVGRAIGAHADDAIIVLWGPEDDVDTGIREVLARAVEAFEGVPAETRQAFADGTTGFERILPGADRMYPDTDSRPFVVPDEWRKSICTQPRDPIAARVAELCALALDDHLALALARTDYVPLFVACASDLPPAWRRRLAWAMVQRLTHHARRYGRPAPHPDEIRALVQHFIAESVPEDAFTLYFDRLVDHQSFAAAVPRSQRVAPSDAAPRIRARLESESAALRSPDPKAQRRWAMGIGLSLLRGRMPAADMSAIVDQWLESRDARDA